MKAWNQWAAANAILFIAPVGSYRLSAFVRTAHQLQIEPVIVSTGHDAVITSTETGIRVDLDDVKKTVDKLMQALTGRAISSVIATDDLTVELASTVAQRLGLSHNSLIACQSARHKDLGRICLAQSGLLTPKFRTIQLSDSIELNAENISFPSVIKPLAMSASRGVIRVNNHKEFIAACSRIKRLLDKEGIMPANCLVEDFIPGQEVAIEGFLRGGRFTPLALFDKPDALDGPYFEETYYITPSRHSEDIQNAII
ncbi:MAG: ATP-grasp domain-containing protein, partial [Gammaproteobacteria bacterium]|nr:ATP-grasp domain-containing protein [Gammaproteobacteria bacterium]